MNRRPPLCFILACLLAGRALAQPAPLPPYDVVVYGGTPAAITAALQAARLGARTALVSPDTHLGGMTANGLGWTDSKDGRAIGGLAREFYHRIWQHYRAPAAWPRGDRSLYAGISAQPGPAIDDAQQVMWCFEPKVAEQVFERWLAESTVEIFRDEWLERNGGVTVSDRRIRRIRMLSGRVFQAEVFIDATYEGDLMAAAGVSYRIGRDRAAEHGEPLNGIYFEDATARYYKDGQYEGISPYRVPGDPRSGLIAGIEGEFLHAEKPGDSDRRLQSFNYRLCLTDRPDNQVSVTRPADYREADYELLLRLYESGHSSGFSTQAMPNGKTDSNNEGLMSLDFVGGNFSAAHGWNYSESDYATRRKIVEDHRRYAQGLLWTIMHHPRVPKAARIRWSRYGLAADEFADNGHWPRQLYVREARRLNGLNTVTQHHVENKPGYETTDSIGLGSYSLDSHAVRRVVVDGRIRTEGQFYVWKDTPYPISYGAIVPRPDDIRNLLVPVTLSATHAAFGSIRMEPTYMILGQSAGAAAVLAAQRNQAVQEIPYAELRRQLVKDGQRLAREPEPR